ncbi:Zn-dependent carboxypeptidase [Candidatus Nitrososphaera evergladensis SR1]|uniref:Metal-dependent carboxypeptidase n=1 Tax=Candidatus Nitrososphaera evergladensis SR1 TaxID=1459636 RepID=A0A075MR55_9ARCH|nr:carboxypeptidase M32 [Candidatus Nitrososphaera evergladensis]AIF83297.1 Zn-dependent carboxypeptidase [Candidatus Nitrososphaera evergladensis SR1]
MKSENPVINQILDAYKPIWSINHATSLMGWDFETYMPRKGTEERGVADSQLRLLYKELLLDKDFVDLVELGKKQEGLNDAEKGIVRMLERNITKQIKIPKELTEAESLERIRGNMVWRQAREKSDFKMYEPYLKKMAEIKKQIAEKIGYEKHPYDALLDTFEEELTVADLDKVFGVLTPHIQKILKKLLDSGSPFCKEISKLGKPKYDIQKVDELNREILTLLQYDMERFRMDVSTHPFTQAMDLNDVRITTRYEGTDFKRSISSTIHEGGHALYDLQCDQSLSVTPVEGASSLALHESQSRFWENIVGRSKPFVQLIAPLIRRKVSFAGQATDDELYLYFNTVKPGYIRVDADEVTYNLHIAIRYEIEKKIIGDELTVSEIPEFWNDRMEQLLGVRPTDDSQGALQDTHWSSGLFGYFPTYTLGNLVSAIIASKMRKDLQDYEENIRNGDFRPVREWLRLKIHQHGSVYAPKTLLKNTFNEEGYNPDYFVKYIENKYFGS